METIIYLDIDGVMNTGKWAEKVHDCVKNKTFNELIRPLSDTEYWKKLCEERNFSYEELMTPEESHFNFLPQEPWYRWFTQYRCFDPECVALLNEFTEKHNGKIVISSLWKADGLEHLRKLFRLVGIKAEVIGVTPRLRKEVFGDERGCEIDAHLKTFSAKPKYIIFDDDDDILPYQREEAFVKTDFMTGIDAEAIDRAEKLLEKQHGTRE